MKGNVDKTAVKVDEDTHNPCARTRAPARATPRSPPLKPRPRLLERLPLALAAHP